MADVLLGEKKKKVKKAKEGLKKKKKVKKATSKDQLNPTKSEVLKLVLSDFYSHMKAFRPLVFTLKFAVPT